MNKKLLLTFIVFILLVSFYVPVKAANFVENFGLNLIFKQPGDPQRPGLWLINSGDFVNGSYQYYSTCGDSSCMTSMQDGPNNWFLRTTMNHDLTPGNYVNMEASELQTGFAYGLGYEDSHPTLGQPVTLVARIRCGSCDLLGTGGHVGSWGLWEWNSYVSGNTVNAITALGFGWNKFGGVFPPGLTMNVLRDNVPLFIAPVTYPGLDLRDWHEYKVVWQTNVANIELVRFYIDGRFVGTAVIPGGMPALSETFWHDNQMVSGINPDGSIVTTFQNPSDFQHIDVDYISVTQ